MSEQLITRVNDAQIRWRQIESETALARATYLRHLETSYEALKEVHQRQSELLISLLNQTKSDNDKPVEDEN